MKKLLILAMVSISMLLVACTNSNSQTPPPTNDIPTNPWPSNVAHTEITVDEAKAIALQHANLTVDQVSFVRTEREFDDGIEKFDIEFYVNDKEYDYEINASTGEIMAYDYAVENYSNSNQQTTPITIEEAKEIALQHANLTNEEVVFSKAERNLDDAIQKYDIEFYINNIEYDYEIDANDGTIIAFKKD